MTTAELRNRFNSWIELHGLDFERPKTYSVSLKTYANVCHSTFTYRAENSDWDSYNGVHIVDVMLGPNSGILFKGVELIIDYDLED